MSARKPKRKAKPADPAPAEVPTELHAAIEAQRQQLFKAAAIIDVCRYACASKYEGFDAERCFDALQVAAELIDGVAEVLEGLAGRNSTAGGSDDPNGAS